MSELKAYPAYSVYNRAATPEESLVYLKSEADAVIAELQSVLNHARSCEERWFQRCMDARGENVGLKRALWLARAESARTSAWVFWNRHDDYHYKKWKNVERKCRTKAEKYKI